MPEAELPPLISIPSAEEAEEASIKTPAVVQELPGVICIPSPELSPKILTPAFEPEP
jgi:hypothetical protein